MKTCKDFGIEPCLACQNKYMCYITNWSGEFENPESIENSLNYFLKFPQLNQFWESVLLAYAPHMLETFRNRVLLLNFK